VQMMQDAPARLRGYLLGVSMVLESWKVVSLYSFHITLEHGPLSYGYGHDTHFTL
jgi:hypothetical protein